MDEHVVTDVRLNAGGMETREMEILIQSSLRMARRTDASIHIRYWERKEDWLANPGGGKEAELPRQEGEGYGKRSYVIIRRPYRQLEPLVRSMFEESEDVIVMLDRREQERRRTVVHSVKNRRNPASDRRSAAPMLDILIDVDT
jgi:hypothetical protein